MPVHTVILYSFEPLGSRSLYVEIKVFCEKDRTEFIHISKEKYSKHKWRKGLESNNGYNLTKSLLKL